MRAPGKDGRGGRGAWVRGLVAAAALLLAGCGGDETSSFIQLTPGASAAPVPPPTAADWGQGVLPQTLGAAQGLTLGDLLDMQPQLLNDALAGLAAQRPGTTDVYFVGFAGDGRQDVFLNEASSARQEVESLYDAAGRSVLLANAAASVGRLPIATSQTLRTTLAAVGSVMDPGEDVLFLLLTSHGNRDGSLTIEVPGLSLEDLTPAMLSGMLAEAGIRNRVLVVSSCFSGVFADRLAGPGTLVITAARRDRTSFGCQNGRQYTYFGEALFGQALPADRVLTTAFEDARRIVSARETSEGLTPSEPQITVGAGIAARLAAVEARVAGSAR